MVLDARLLTGHIAAAHPGRPIVLVGHSMGSFIVQDYLRRWGDGMRAAVLTGTGGTFTAESRAEADELALRLDAASAREGRDVPSTEFAKRFASFNDRFVVSGQESAATGFEWLSRDPVEVQRYVDDPWCGRPLSNGFMADMIAGRKALAAPDVPGPLATGLPVLITAGDQDPVGGADAERVRLLAERYRASGMSVTEKIYPGARHELFNETNRDEVHADLLAWLDAVVT
jgi:alpha-beta hydrolase superfamily lysophospholipase